MTSKFRRTLAMLFVVAAIFATTAAVSTPKCLDGFRSVAAATALDENLDLLRRGQFVIERATSGEKYLIRAEMSFRAAPAQDEAVGTVIGKMQFEGRAIGSRAKAKPVGDVEVFYHGKTRTLEISRTFIEDGFKKNGLSTTAIGAALIKFPETEVVAARLIDDNAKLFKADFFQNATGSSDEGLRPAFMKTSLYKTMSAYGFTEIDMTQSYFRPESPNLTHQIFLQLRRPES